MEGDRPLRCPVCRAGLRGTRACSRCGADLTALMALITEAWNCRGRARRAIRSGDLEDACALAEQAQGLHATEAGARLSLLVRWLVEAGSSEEEAFHTRQWARAVGAGLG